MTKNEVRRIMRERTLGLTAAQRAAASERIFSRAERLAVFARARTVGLYCALADEPDTAGPLERWCAGRRLVVPRVEGDAMQFYEYDPLTLRRGAFGIPEPGPEARLCQPSEIDLLFVPGTAFAADGARCGRGKGYYDRYLAQPDFRAATVGVCFAHQLLGELPVEAHDIRMDRVLRDR